MGTGTNGLIIVAAVVAIIVLWIISSQRKLVKLDELCKNALSQIGVQQNSRWDALGALADLTKQYSDHEYNALVEVIGRRRSITGSSSVADANVQENAITEAMGRIMAISEAYPNLKVQMLPLSLVISVHAGEGAVAIGWVKTK